MAGFCREGCGACCDPVVLPYLPADVRKLMQRGLMDTEDGQFMLEHLTMLPRREGLRRADYLTQGGATFGIVEGVGTVMFSFFYECDFFDADTRECTNYDGRPPMCRSYPLYGDAELDGSKAVPRDCSYRPDWTPVTMGREAPHA